VDIFEDIKEGLQLIDPDETSLEQAEQLLETYYLEQLIELSNLTEAEALAILMDTGLFTLPEVLPL
jgi:hypothetical protein